jgi:curved DNA-binding protein CbpA
MSRDYQYRPKFVDIRVRPPKAGEAEAARDVNALKPGQRACDHPDCLRVAEARAPKSRDLLNDYYWFCPGHASEYNKRWDFYAGMSEGEVRKRQEEELMTGGRPTWSMKADSRSREAALQAAKDARHAADPFGLFKAARDKAAADRAAHERKIGKIERSALADLDLDATADSAAIRVRYTELIKRCHPDANGGDRSAEHKLQRVIKAYKTLRKAGLA